MFVHSMLDTDFYKLTQQWAILHCYPNAVAEYTFHNRRLTNTFAEGFVNRLREAIDVMAELRATDAEIEFLEKSAPFLPPQYLEYFRNYRFDPKEVSVGLKEENQLDLRIRGPWHRTVLWEVPLMSSISELYFQTIQPNWGLSDQANRARQKAKILNSYGCYFSEFGTRRRRSYMTQKIVVNELQFSPTFVGTSNVYLAMKFGVRFMGTQAHEWDSAIAVLEGMRHAPRFKMDKWVSVYGSNLGIALTDTFGTDAFFQDFSLAHAKLWDGLRHDSGCPKTFTDKAINHYEKLKIDSRSKALIFSDALCFDLDRPEAEVEKGHNPLLIHQYVNGRAKDSYGIGTFFTNDFADPALNMVIKLSSINGIPVVKLSDDPGKAIGNADAVRVAKWTFLGEPLDNEPRYRISEDAISRLTKPMD